MKKLLFSRVAQCKAQKLQVSPSPTGIERRHRVNARPKREKSGPHILSRLDELKK